MTYELLAPYITGWLSKYLEDNKQRGYVIGVSGGIDSAVVSTLCARTGAPVLAISMPIHQKQEQVDLADAHLNWLRIHFSNVQTMTINLTPVFDVLSDTLPEKTPLSLANTRSRLRMVTLYNMAGSRGYLVAGTGNLCEDMILGFFSKFGDGGVDLSPIGDLLKSDVWGLGEYLGVDPRIIKAAPVDGLWEDNRTDESQIGYPYKKIEEVITRENFDDFEWREINRVCMDFWCKNSHKMAMPPICKIPKEIKDMYGMKKIREIFKS